MRSIPRMTSFEKCNYLHLLSTLQLLKLVSSFETMQYKGLTHPSNFTGDLPWRILQVLTQKKKKKGKHYTSYLFFTNLMRFSNERMSLHFIDLTSCSDQRCFIFFFARAATSGSMDGLKYKLISLMTYIIFEI